MKVVTIAGSRPHFVMAAAASQTLAWRGGIADIRVIGPVGYFDMARLLADCVEVHTDSGGLQKEAYFRGKLCTTLRDETEWVETIEAGWNRLWRSERLPQRHAISDYGHGDAGRRIAVLLAGMPVREQPSS